MLLLPSAMAITLQEAVDRAAEVDPNVLIAAYNSQIGHLESIEAWSQLGLSPSLSYSARTPAGVTTPGFSLTTSVGLLEPGTWLNAFQQRAQAQVLYAAEDAIALDVQYLAATLFYNLLEAQARTEAAQSNVAAAQASLDAITARVQAGLVSELDGRTVELAFLRAQAEQEAAQASERIARARLSRALEQQVDRAESTTPPQLPDSGESLHIETARRSVEAARFGYYERVADLFPSGFLRADQWPGSTTWAVTVGATWSFDGIVGPFTRARVSKFELRIAETELAALQLDNELGITAAREEAQAARALADAARKREDLAEETLKVAQARLTAGLTNTVDLLRIQDDTTQARADRVQAEADYARAILEVRRLSGVGWE